MSSQPNRLAALLMLLLALTACAENLKTENAALLASAREEPLNLRWPGGAVAGAPILVATT